MTEQNEGHTLKRYDAELAHLRDLVLEMGGLVLEQIHQAVNALRKQDLELAQEVIDRDNEVNAYDVKADRATVRLIALRQPVANDLRLVVAVSKAISDLERCGDEAVKIARMCEHLYNRDSSAPGKKLLRDVKGMTALATAMLRQSIDAFDRMDVAAAVEQAQQDPELDSEFQAAMRRLATFVMEDSRTLGHALDVIFVLKALERVGDHAANIAEYVVFLVNGRDVRHVAVEDLPAHSLSDLSRKQSAPDDT